MLSFSSSIFIISVTHVNIDETDESKSSRAALVISDKVNLVDFAVLGEVTLKITSGRRIAEMLKTLLNVKRNNDVKRLQSQWG